MKSTIDNENLYIRPRINELFELGMLSSEIIVSAPSGFGKTKAVSEFLKQSEHKGVWQHLNLFDNIPSRFWASFVYVVSLHKKDLSDQLKELGFPDTLYKFDKFFRLFTKELYEDNQLVVFVFDDFHLIEDASVLKFFEYFVSAKLENICIIMVTRNPSEKMIHTEVLEGYPFIINTDDLRFTEDEGVDYLRQYNNASGSSSDLNNLYKLTNGWPVALYLLNLQMQKNPESMQSGLIDSQQMLYGLIESEIFSSYNDIETDFFVQLSILNFCSKGLLNAIFPNKDFDAENLLRSNPFVIYDQAAKNYYLHQIFISFLSERQNSVSEETKVQILNAAAEWCKQNEYFVDATEYYYLAGKFESIFQMIEGFDTNPFPKNETEFYIEYIEKCPPTYMENNPMYRIIYAILLINNLEIDKSYAQMDLIYEQLSSGDDTEENQLLLGEAYAASGMISLSLGKTDFVEYFEKAEMLLPSGSRWWKEDTKLVNYSNALNITSTKQGAIEKSLDSFMRGMPIVSKVLNGAGYGLEYLAAAEAAYLTGDIKEARKNTYEAIYRSQDKQQIDIFDNALYLLLRIFLINGDIKGIEEVLERFNGEEGKKNVEAQTVADIALSWFYSDIEQISEVSNWIFYVGESNQSLISIDKDILLRVRCLIQEQRYYEAMAMLDRIEDFYIKKNVLISRIYIHVYRAVTYYGLEDEESAFDSIKSAYDLANENKIIIPFVEFGQKTRSILRNMISSGYKGVDMEWLETVHAKASTYAKRHSHLVAHFSDINEKKTYGFSLSSREKELLSHLSQGLTREEIAESMYISPHTVKSMVKTVYNKIGAINNADAVRIATAANLI